MSESADVAVAAAEPVSGDRQYLDLPAPRPDFEYPLNVTYCGECSFPLEYCENGAAQQRARCRAWLEKALPDVFARLNSEVKPAAASSAPTASANSNAGDGQNDAAAGSNRQKRGGKGVARKEKDAPAAAAEGEEQPAAASGGGKKHKDASSKHRVRISTVPRGKGKFVTAVSGLNSIEKDLKVLAKALGTKMACGASVSNVDTGEIVVQGDVAEKLKIFLLDKYSSVLSPDQIDIAEKAD